MELVIIGSLAVDKIHLPSGEQSIVFGGSALYSSLAAAKFANTSIIAAVGEDRKTELLGFLTEHGVDVDLVETKNGSTFFWEGRYFEDINNRETLHLDLGVFADFKPEIRDEKYKSPKILFLANIDPDLQQDILDSCNPKFVALDTMDHWIGSKRANLVSVLNRIDLLIINDSEARLLSGERNIYKAANVVLDLMKGGYLIIKRGEYGALLFYREDLIFVPAYPLEEPVDPTGAGDSFAGAFLGYWASQDLKKDALPESMLYASATASFSVEGIGPHKLALSTKEDISNRVNCLNRLMCGHFRYDK